MDNRRIPQIQVGAQTRQVLEKMGSFNGESDFERRPKTWKDTFFLDAGAAGVSIVDYDFFRTTNKDKQWQEGVFPNTSQSFEITHLRVTHSMKFTPSDPALQMLYLQYFLECSWIEFVSEHNELTGRYFLADLVTHEVHSDPGITLVASEATRDKLNDWYKLPVPMVIGAGKTFTVGFHTAKGLTTAVYGAALTPYLPNADVTFTNADRGHHLSFWMKGMLYSEAKA